MNNQLATKNMKEYYKAKDAKDIINAYIAQENLEDPEQVKRGHIKLDPYIVKLVGDCKPE